jgi:hypothetical protein
LSESITQRFDSYCQILTLVGHLAQLLDFSEPWFPYL